MRDDLTRRELAALLTVLPAAAPAQVPAGAEADPLETARERLRETVAKLEAFPLPMAAEPAFVFRP